MTMALLMRPVIAALPVFALVFGAGFFRGSFENAAPHWYTFGWLVDSGSNVNLVGVAAVSMAVLAVAAAYRR